MDGSPATVNSTAYLEDGVCTPLDARTHSETALPNLTAPGLPERLAFQVLRIEHGVVQLRTTAAGGTPVAIGLQRSTYQHEVDSIMGFSRVNDPGFVRDAASFQRAMDGVDYFVALHRFDGEGRHVDSDIWCAGSWREQQQFQGADRAPLARTQARMRGLLDALPEREYGDIAIRPFRLTVDGVVFGLVTEQGHGEIEDTDDWAELYPDGLGFSEPWDGQYST